MGLGWLRFVLSLMVIDFHYAFFSGHIQPWLADVFGVEYLAYAGGGNIAVSGFFVISGFVIAWALSQKYTSTWRGIAAFYAGRALRIYPLYLLIFAAYWLALAFIAASQATPHPSLAEIGRNLMLFPSPPELGANLLLFSYGITGFFADHNQQGPLFQHFFIGPAWTLAYDLVFYAVAPWLVTRKDRLWIVWAVGLAYYLAFAMYLDARQPVWEWYFYTNGMPLLFAFASGALLYHYRQFRPSGWSLAVATLCLVQLSYLPLGFNNVTLNQLMSVLAFTVLVAGLRGRGKLDQRLGDLTYATYLLHLPVAQIMAQLGLIGDSMLLALPVTYALAFAALYLVEQPLDRVRDRVFHRLHDTGNDINNSAAPAWDRPVAAGLLAALLLTGTASVRANLPHHNADTHLTPTTLPQGWLWSADGTSMRITPRSPGEANFALAPSHEGQQRILLGMQNTGTRGETFAGIQYGSLIFGIERKGNQCNLVVNDGKSSARNPAGWSQNCSIKHSFLVNPDSGLTSLVVDGIWELGNTTRPGTLSAMVVEGEASAGSVTFSPMFMWDTQRAKPQQF